MTPSTPFAPPAPHSEQRRFFKSYLMLLSAVLITIVVISCVTVDRLAMSPPQIPGATFVGAEACAPCHEERVKNFKTATHSRLMAKGKNAEGMGCESCHGPGSKHVEAGGGRNTVSKINIINPRKSPETCFQCHLDKRGEFKLPHSHPVLAGKMSCVDCHEPHKGDAVIAGGTGILSQNDVCFKCHTAQKGPFIYEHEALREGCVVCHKPHGSVNARMLSERSGNLCLRCHFQQQTAGGGTFFNGTMDHTPRVSQGTCWSARCHADVHGSQVDRHLMPSG